MSDSENHLEGVLEGIKRIIVNRKPNTGNSQGDNWWTDKSMAATAEHLRVIVDVAIETARN